MLTKVLFCSGSDRLQDSSIVDRQGHPNRRRGNESNGSPPEAEDMVGPAQRMPTVHERCDSPSARS